MIGSLEIRCKHRSTSPPSKRKRGNGASSSSSSSSSSGGGASGCAWTGPLRSRQAHIDGECDFAPVPCPLAAVGCCVRPERRALAAHTSEAAPMHVELMALAHASVLTELGQSKAAHAELKAVQVAQATRLNQLEALIAYLQSQASASSASGSTHIQV